MDIGSDGPTDSARGERSYVGPPPTPEPLPADEVHVWQASLDSDAGSVEALSALLSPDERARAARYRFERDRRRYATGRGWLRVLLGRYLGLAPARVRLRYGAHDKPFLEGAGPWFNLSHSGAIALFAFSAQAELGIDVERLDPAFAGARVPEHFFSPGEVATLRALPAAAQPRAFLACWTRKEAFIKARGDGLSLALDSFDVTLAPGEPAALTRTAWSAGEPARWALVDVSDPGGRYVAALASRSQGWRVVRRSVEELGPPLKFAPPGPTVSGEC